MPNARMLAWAVLIVAFGALAVLAPTVAGTAIAGAIVLAGLVCFVVALMAVGVAIGRAALWLFGAKW